MLYRFIVALIVFNASLVLADLSNPEIKEESEVERAFNESINNAVSRYNLPSSALTEILFDTAPQDFKDFLTVTVESHKAKESNPREWYSQISPSRLLLVGPPGVGKSSLACVIARKLDRDLFFIKAPMLGNEYKNSESVYLSRVINEIISLRKPCVIVIDEINILAEPKKELGSDLSIPSTLWLLLDKCAEYSHIMIVGTCNDATKLPLQLKDRFAGNVIEIPLCDEAGRFQILRYYLDFNNGFICSNDFIRKMAKKTQNLSPRQLEILVANAQRCAFLRYLSGKGLAFLEEEDVEVAFWKLMKTTKILQSRQNRIYEWMKENSFLLPYFSFGGQVLLGLATVAYYLAYGKSNVDSQSTHALY